MFIVINILCFIIRSSLKVFNIYDVVFEDLGDPSIHRTSLVWKTGYLHLRIDSCCCLFVVVFFYLFIL